MLFLNGLFQAAADDVGINLRRRDIGMAEHFLDAAQVGAAGQEVRCESVTQDVRRNALFIHIRRTGEVFQKLGETLVQKKYDEKTGRVFACLFSL